MKAMIFAAGLGTRLRPLTDSMPKALVPVGGKPLLGRLVEKLKHSGYDEIVVNVHHFADQIIEYIRSNEGFGVKISLSDESGGLLDTGGGLLHARGLIECAGNSPAGDVGGGMPDDGRFLVHNVDILSNLDFSLLNGGAGAGKGAPAGGSPLATLVVSDRRTSRYLLFDENMRLVGWENKATGEIRTPYKNLPRATALAFSGIHLLSGDVFPELEKYAAVHGEAFPIIDFYLSVCHRFPVLGYVPPDFRMIDVGKAASLAEAESFLSEI